MYFWKMNGAGNDFIIFNNIELKLPMEKYRELAPEICERHMSLGADGLMVVDRAEGDADFHMTYLNADGSIGEMCGNGARCICRYGYENGLSGEHQVVETSSGTVTGERIDGDNYRIRLTDVSVCELDYPIVIDGKTYDCSYVELGCPGLPHAVVPVSNLEHSNEHELFELGRKMRYAAEFPKGANVNFYEITGQDEVFEKTYERGVEDFTYACGTGTGSLVKVLAGKGLVSGNDVKVRVRGGLLKVTVTDKDLFLTGPTKVVCKGELVL